MALNKILPEIEIVEKIGYNSKFSGMDNQFACIDADHYRNFQHNILYQFNSRGFRDVEWPDDSQLNSAVWCVGDSFTVGIGSPFEHTWPQALQQRTQQRSINVSMDGASNEWLAETCCKIYSEIRPSNMVVMWSFPHRRQSADHGTPYSRRLQFVKSTLREDYENFLDCRNLVRSHCTNTNLIELVIPNWQIGITRTAWEHIRKCHWQNSTNCDWPRDVDEIDLNRSDIIDALVSWYNKDRDLLIEQLTTIKQIPVLDNLIQVPLIDRARDGYHFDVATSNWVVDQIQRQLK